MLINLLEDEGQRWIELHLPSLLRAESLYFGPAFAYMWAGTVLHAHNQGNNRSAYGNIPVFEGKPSMQNNKEGAFEKTDPTLKDSSNPGDTTTQERIKSFCTEEKKMDPGLSSGEERRTHYLPVGWQLTRWIWPSYRKSTSYLWMYKLMVFAAWCGGVFRAEHCC